jgi:ATP/maltotriose-dependent transcriptional regulator MalT
MAALLELFGHRKRFESYIGEILAAFDRFEAQTLQNIPSPQTSHLQTPSLEAAPNLDKPLTNRELEILSSLSKRLSNKEIAEELFISPETVKRHTINIYKKLASHSRQEAVTKARALGILEE